MPPLPRLGRGKGKAVTPGSGKNVAVPEAQEPIDVDYRVLGNAEAPAGNTGQLGKRRLGLRINDWFYDRKENVKKGFSKAKQAAGKVTSSISSVVSDWRESRAEAKAQGGGIFKKVGKGAIVGAALVGAGILTVGSLIGRGFSWLNRRREGEQNYSAFIVVGLIVWLIQVRMFNWGAAPLTNWTWYYINLGAMLVCGLLTPVDYRALMVITVFEAGLPWGLPYLNQVALGFLHANPNKAIQMGITLFTLPAVYPIWLIYGLKHSRSRWARWLMNGYIVLLAILGLYATAEYTYNASIMPTSPGMTFDPQTLWGLVVDTAKNLGKGFTSFWTGTQYWVLNEATGGLYEAQVEKGQKEPLGVTIEDVVVASPSYYYSEPVIVWATIHGRTVTDPIPVHLSCWVGEGDKRVDGTILHNDFLLNKDEVKDFDCRFEGGMLRVGQNIVYVAVEYKFTTMSYLKAYFMDQERMRSMKKEEVENYINIKDTNPKAIYTNGPVELSLGTTMALMPVSDDPNSNVPPKLSMMVRSRWDGELKSIDKFNLSLPNTITATMCYPDFIGPTEKEDRNVYDMALDKPLTDHLDQPRVFKCDLEVTKPITKLFGDAPLSMVYFRVTAVYHYQIKGSATVKVLEDLSTGDGSAIPTLVTSTTTTTIYNSNPTDSGGTPP